MTYQWISKTNKNRLIVFFNGWGMDENPFSHLSVSEFDLIMFYDYRDINFPLEKKSFQSYQEIIFIGFSMGVWASNYFQDYFPASKRKAIAVNGTLKPIDDQFGIPAAFYDRTMNGLTEEGLEKFFKKMFSGKEEVEKFSAHKPQRDFITRKEELSKLKEYILDKSIVHSFESQAVFISENDRIIPTQSQVNFWNEQKVSYKMLPCGHFPFYLWKSYEELIREAFLDR